MTGSDVIVGGCRFIGEPTDKKIKIKRLFDAKHREKPRRGDAAEMAVIELV